MELSKKGSARRKGDEYQDLIALRFALENYIARKPFEMYLEYEKSGNLDDIVLFIDNKIISYQVKYAVNPLDVYTLSDFTDPTSRVYLRKFADSWKIMKERFPTRDLVANLCSNKGLDANLLELVTPEGEFSIEVIENRKRGNARKIRSELKTASGLDEREFSSLLGDFRFLLRQMDMSVLEEYIGSVLLNKELGLSDASMLYDLKETIKQNSIFSKEPITLETIDSLLERLQSKLLIPQVFPVNYDHFIEQQSLAEQLDEALFKINGDYLIVTGLPGSGKSTSLTAYLEKLDKTKYEVCSYYCFVGVNDNSQRMRIQAESLRANLLSEFHRRYPNILKRRFDYSERHFLECLETLGQYFTERKHRLVILLDGLDHAERLDAEIRDTVITALPASVPEGITIIVGTQELHKWPHFIKRTLECPESYIKMPLFSEDQTQDYLINKRVITGLSGSDISIIHNKCEGLPLYLRYIAEILVASDSLTEAINSLAPASGGDIRNYYRILWEEFDRVGMSTARHLCTIMACVRFGINRDELYGIAELNRPTFEDAFLCIKHLLRDSDNRLSVFHNSFREFVISQVANSWVNEVKGNICEFLKSKKNTPLWFGHVFQYCYDTEDYQYILDEVTPNLVELALLHCRPSKEILDAIDLAVEAAFKVNNIVQLSRLGSLKHGTNERLEHVLDRKMLADVLLGLGREQDVMTFAFSQENNHWLVDPYISLTVMYRLAEEGKLELGKKLFDVFAKEFRGIQPASAQEERLQAIGIARCLAVYSTKFVRPLQWLSQFEFSPDILEEEDSFAPGFEPQLSAYIDTLVKFNFTDKLNRLSQVKRLFPNSLVRFYIIRALARYNRTNELQNAVTEYVQLEQPSENLEMGFYAAKAGLPASIVTEIAGTIRTPLTSVPNYISRSDPIFKNYLYSFIVAAYEENKQAYESLVASIGIEPTFWNSAIRYLLEVGNCIGQAFRDTSADWFEDACKSIRILVNLKEGDHERICDSIDVIRGVLPLSIGLLTERIQISCPEKLKQWISELAALRESLLWHTHFGISESLEDYSFELLLWGTLAEIISVRPLLAPILKDCAQGFEKATMIKGGSRPSHFLWLSSIMAKCGMRDEAEKWLSYGIRSSLIYGYHKDLTLLYLIDILNMVNQHQPSLALERCARVLSLVDWMPHLTDGRETKAFPEKAFESVLNVNRRAAFELLIQFSRSKARWQMLDCLEQYICKEEDGDPEFLWCLSEVFTNCYSEDGSHCQQIIGTRKHIVDLVQKSCSAELHSEFSNRFRLFIMTEITPRHWPDQLKEEFNIALDTEKENRLNSIDKYLLDGERINKEDIITICKETFTVFLSTLDKLKKQNDHFYEQDIVNRSIEHHIATATSIGELVPITEFLDSQDRWQDANVIEKLAERFVEYGDYEKAIGCYGMAYFCHTGWFRWQTNKKYLSAVAARSKQTAKEFVLKECYHTVDGYGGGYNTPPIAASGFDVLDEPELLEAVSNDYLIYCESMFAQLPKKETYAWLKDYKEPTVNPNKLILEFVIDEMSTLEIDLGNRLIRAVSKLALARPDITISILADKILTASGRTFRRLLTVFYIIATQRAILLVPHQELFTQLLDREDYFCRQTVMYILFYIEEVARLDDSVVRAMQHVELNYSTQILHSPYQMPVKASPEFMNFLKRNILFDFYDQVMLIDKILRVTTGSTAAAIEEHLKKQSWSMEEEKIRLKDNWYRYVHPQGWPVIWITTDFQELVADAIGGILNEAATKVNFSQEQICQLWQLFQPADPDFVLNGSTLRPADIKPLNIMDKDKWFEEFTMIKSFQIRDASEAEDWITVFEKRIISQEEKFNVPYRQEAYLKTFLIPQQVYGSAHKLDELELITERIVPYSKMSVTIQQAQAIIEGRGREVFSHNEDSMPLIAVHSNSSGYFGFWGIPILASYIISDFNLSFKGNDIVRDGEIVARFEAWQEGYQDEVYTREKLSFGVRLLVSKKLLTEICRRYHKILCTRIDEKRNYHKDIYNHEPTEYKHSWRYILCHL